MENMKIPKDFDPVLSKEQIKAMIENTKSLKHRLLIELLYSYGFSDFLLQPINFSSRDL